MGVEIGQCLALTAVLIALSVWRTRRISATRIFYKHTAHGGRFRSRGISGHGILGGTIMETRKHSSNAPLALEGPSRGQIAIATVIALIVAAVLLVVAVLPAEYGIDPLKTGKALGLMDLAQASEKPQAVASASDKESASIVPTLVVSKGWGRTYRERHIHRAASWL